MQAPWTAWLTILLYGAAAFALILLLRRLIWAARLRNVPRLEAAGAVVLVGLIAPTHMLVGLPQNTALRALEGAADLLLYLLPCAGLALAATLLVASLRQLEQGERRSWLTLLLFGALFSKVMHNLYGLLAWDQTTDPLWIILMLPPLVVAGTSGLLMLPALRGGQRVLGLAYALIVPALLVGILNDTGRIDLLDRTEASAGQVAQALEQYHARVGRYPENLGRLSPLYTLGHPRPWIIYGQDWCYQASDTGSAYRLGYVFREHWSSPELSGRTAVESGAGDKLPAAETVCDAEIQALIEQDDIFTQVWDRGTQ